MTAPVRDLWIFAYGSLMWQPGFAYEEACHARLDGHHRAFCVYSVHYRGSPRRPGLVLGLDRGGVCEGVAFRPGAARAAETLAYLRRRELIYGVYREALLPVTLLVAGRPRVLACAFVAEPAHPAHARALPLRAQAALIRGAEGAGGTNLDYLINTLARLRSLDIRDPRLERALTMTGGAFARGEESGALGRAGARSFTRAWKAKTIRTPRLTRDRRFAYRKPHADFLR